MSADGDRMMSAQRAFKARRRAAKTDRSAAKVISVRPLRALCGAQRMPNYRTKSFGIQGREPPDKPLAPECIIVREGSLCGMTESEFAAWSARRAVRRHFLVRCLIRSTLWILLALSALIVFAVCVHEVFGQTCCTPEDQMSAALRTMKETFR